MNRQSQSNSHRSPGDRPAGGNKQSAAALKGASLAFRNPKPNATTEHPNAAARRNDGARAAALAVGASKHAQKQSVSDTDEPVRLNVKEQVRNLENVSSRPSLRPTSSAITVTGGRRPSPVRSTSHIAAQIASLRSPAPEISRREKAEHTSPAESSDVEHLPPDQTSAVAHHTVPSIVTPKPIRASTAGQHLLQIQQQREGIDDHAKIGLPATRNHASPGQALEAALGAFTRSPSRTPSTSVRSERSRSSSIVSRPRNSMDSTFAELRDPPFSSRPRDIPTTGRRPRGSSGSAYTAASGRVPSVSGLREASLTPLRPKISPTTSEGDSGRDVPSPSHRSSSQAFTQIHVHESPQLLDQKTRLTESALADAMVASSLASSRVPSPHKHDSRPPPPPRHPSKSRGFLHLKKDSGDFRTTSPPKKPVLRQTLRKPSKSNEEEEEVLRRGRRHLVRKHHRKHHEGDRKKWRDEVTERQRKRYEGLWASNRGLFMDAEPTGVDGPGGRSLSDLVINLVVRDIWKRSRLPDDVLEEIWNLVDRTGAGALARDEFVVGMWLIDQRLRGRKLPIRVSYSVWASVRHSVGLQVKNKIK